jgi:hypothetical protein
MWTYKKFDLAYEQSCDGSFGVFNRILRCRYARRALRAKLPKVNTIYPAIESSKKGNDPELT